MTFDEVLTQVLELLQREKRVSYRALKRRFDLNDEYLEDLKDEIIKAKRLAIDEEGSVLVWIGDTIGTANTISPPVQPDQPTHQAPLQQHQHTPEAERRQLTVMFCDLVDSTKMASQLDPEEYRDVVRAYQRVCSEIITRYDGHIAQLLGDGLLVYFGYPQAHEDDAQRAVRAGLGMLAAMGDLNKTLQQTKGIQLAIRLGVHTGLVVIGEMGGAGRQEQLALGEVPNVASRIQGRAAPNTLAVSEATYHLVEGYFTCEALGEHTLRGISQPLHIYRVLGESGIYSRLDVAQTRGLTPLVGRESEVTLLMERWEQVKAGQGQVVLLSGDAGIGKSRLVQTLKEHSAHESHARWECRSSPYFEHTALFPVTDLFQRVLQFQAEDTQHEKLAKLEQMLSQYRLPLAASVPLFAPLFSLSIPEHQYSPLNLSPQRQRQKTLEALVAVLLEQAEQQPVLFILEDLHWTDPTTLELLNLLIEQIPTTSVLAVLTCRPTFQPSWSHRSYLTEITVNRLSHTQVAQIVHRLTDGKTLPQEVLAQIIDKTDGVPLFVEEMTKAILESGSLKEVDEHYELTGSLSTFAIPATLQDSLMARLDRLVTAKAVAQYAAVIGRQFSYDLLHAVSQLDETMLQHELSRLVGAEIVYQRGVPPHSTYVFKHALIQDAAYESLLKSTRQHYHQRIAQVLESQFPDTTEGQPELLAHHYTEAGLAEQAIPYWQRAGQRAMERSAHVEAVSHLTKGIEVLVALPETTERIEQELRLQTTLGPALMAAKGFGAPEVERAYARARDLCMQVGETPQLFSVLWGLWYFYLARAAWQTTHGLGEQLLNLAQRVHDATLLLLAHRALGQTLAFLGAFAPAQTHLEQAMALYNPAHHRSLAFQYGQDQDVICRSWTAVTLWLLGSPDQALRRAYEALTLAEELAHPFSVVYALNWTAIVHLFRREGPGAHQRAEEAVTLSREHGFTVWMAWGTFLRGWALAAQEQYEAGISEMRQGITDWRGTGNEVFQPYCLALLAESAGKADQGEEGLSVLAEALTQVDARGERFYEAEIYRLKGELLLQQNSDNQAEAETCFHHAISIAQNQQAKSWELRASTSLARLWHQQGKLQEAYDLLAPVYNWFTEGFDTTDLKDAKALLDTLA